MISFQEAAALAREPAQKARALGEVSVLAQDGDRPRIAVQAACDALRVVSGAARASHLYNLGRSAELLRDVASATALYTASVALRPNSTVSARLGELSGGKSAARAPASPAPAASSDPALSFCQAALGPPPAVTPELRRLAEGIATQRGEKVALIARRPLGVRGELFQVAYLCHERSHGAWLIEVDATHRYLVAIDKLDEGHDEFDACGDNSELLYAGRGVPLALGYRRGFHGGYEDYKVAVRSGRPVVIFVEKLEDSRTSGGPRQVDYDQKNSAYPDVKEFARLILLDESGMQQVAPRE